MKNLKKNKEDVEFRYYTVDSEFPVLPLVGDHWMATTASLGKPSLKLHFHNLLEIGYCHQGEGTLTVEDSEYSYAPGTFTIIPKNILHDTQSKKGSMNFWEYIFVDEKLFLEKFYLNNFDGKGIFEGIETSFLVSDEKSQPLMAAEIKSILEEFRSRSKYYREKVNALLVDLFLSHARAKQPQSIGDDIVKNRSAIMAVLEYIDNNFDEDMTVSSLAKMCSVSEPYFRRIFKSVTDRTPLEHINRVRIQKACVFLLRDEESIINVALKCGFSSVSTFNRNFIRYVGCTPSEYRQNHTVHRGVENFTIRNYPGW